VSTISNDQDPAPRRFDAFQGERHRAAHARRTAETHAGFVLPVLRPGMLLLDCGCGPGTMTAGLARAIAPGYAVGIDISIEVAELLDEAGTVRLCAADASSLPFADSTFDVTFVYSLFQHLPDPRAALREMHRVLKPGGLIAVADADYDGSIIAPEDPLLAGSMRLIAALRAHAGRGNARVGKHLRALLNDAGFERVEASARAAAYGTDTSVRQTGAFWASYFRSEELAEQLTAAGLSSASELEEMSTAWRRWSSDPGAFWATFWCEAIARKR